MQASFRPPRPPEFIMHALDCYLQTGKPSAEKVKKIASLILEFQKKCAAEEVKFYEALLKELR